MKAKLGPVNLETLWAMGNLANSYRAAGRFDDALRLNEQTYRLMKAKLGPDQRDTLASMDNLAASFRDVGRFDEAFQLDEEALKRMKSKLGPDHSCTLNTMDSLAETCLPVNRPAEAELLTRECLAIRQKTSPDEWTMFNTQSLLGGALLAQKKYAEAEPLLVSGYKGMRDRTAKMPADEKTRLKDAIQRLVQLYEATNRPEKAVEWKAKMGETRQSGNQSESRSAQERHIPDQEVGVSKRGEADVARDEQRRQMKPPFIHGWHR